MTLEELQAIAMGVDVGDPLPPLPFEALGEDLELRLAPVANALFRLNALHEAIFSLCESFKKWIRQLAKRLLADSLASSASAPPEGPEAARPKTALAQLKELSIERFEGMFFPPTAPISPICRTPLFPYLTLFFIERFEDVMATVSAPMLTILRRAVLGRAALVKALAAESGGDSHSHGTYRAQVVAQSASMVLFFLSLAHPPMSPTCRTPLFPYLTF